MRPLKVSKEIESDNSVLVECGGASTTSAGSWHLGVLAGTDTGREVSDWLSTYINKADIDKVRGELLQLSSVRRVDSF